MPYKPTGRPPGRPKTKVEPPASSLPMTSLPPAATHSATPPLVPPPAGREHAAYLVLGELCAECWPAGWPPGWTGIACKHGSWFRRIA